MVAGHKIRMKYLAVKADECIYADLALKLPMIRVTLSFASGMEKTVYFCAEEKVRQCRRMSKRKSTAKVVDKVDVLAGVGVVVCVRRRELAEGEEEKGKWRIRARLPKYNKSNIRAEN